MSVFSIWRPQRPAPQQQSKTEQTLNMKEAEDKYENLCGTERLRKELAVKITMIEHRARIAGRMDALLRMRVEVSRMMRHNATPRAGDWPYGLKEVSDFIRDEMKVQLNNAFKKAEAVEAPE